MKVLYALRSVIAGHVRGNGAAGMAVPQLVGAAPRAHSNGGALLSDLDVLVSRITVVKAGAGQHLIWCRHMLLLLETTWGLLILLDVLLCLLHRYMWKSSMLQLL